MNKSRVSSLLLTLFSALFLLSGLTSRAQTTTNTAVLQKASQQSSADHKSMQQVLIRAALQHGWPLTMRDKKGRKAYLRGINSRGLPYYITTVDNIISAATIGTNHLWPGGTSNLNLNGGGANLKGKIAIWDEGVVRPTHVELVGRVVQEDVAQGDTALSDHSTHVSGTLIATGVNPVAKGMSNGAQLLQCYDFNNDAAEMMTAAANGLLISNHSYGTVAGWNPDATFTARWDWWGEPGDTVDINFGLYDQETQLWDSIAYNAPYYLIAKAAGNNPGDTGPPVGTDYWRLNAAGNFYNAGARPNGISNNFGYETLPTTANAKNIMVIGAVNPIPGGYTRPGDVVWSGFSSEGPTGDGRIKPDLVADGVNVLSSISTADNAYDIYSGTSMATPASCGSGFLLQQYYSQLHGSTTFLRSSTLKGILIHTADEAGPSPGPDYIFGWGLIDMVRATSVITSDNTDHSQQIIESSLTGSTPATYSVVASGKTPLWATICWIDPPGTPVKNPESQPNFQDVGIKLVNDLDLRITDNTTNTVYMPWVLDPAPANRSHAATKGNNYRDNVEKVELTDSAVPGRTYTITVSHNGMLARGGQAYSLIISGVGGAVYCSSASAGGSTGTAISNVMISNLNHTDPSPCPNKNYSDLTGQTPIQLPVGQPGVPISINYQTCSGSTTTNIAVYLDANNNDTFETNELVLLKNGLSSSTGSANYTGSITIPVTATPGSYARMRVIAEDNGSAITPLPCGIYPSGETQDYMVAFTNSANDVGVMDLEYPTQTGTICPSDSQLVAVRIHNFGTVAQTGGVPVSTVVTQGGSTIATFSAICKDSIPAGGDVVYTYSGGTLPTKGGASYTFVSHTSLSGDFNTANDADTIAVTINAAGPTANASATVCGPNATSTVLHATTTGDDVAVWYASQTATTPIAAGNNTTTTDVQKTYYVGLNALTAKGGPANSATYAPATASPGEYYPFNGPFVDITTSVPLTLESARLYVGHQGQVTFTLATLASLNSQGFSYFPVTSVTLDVYPSKQTPQSGQVQVKAGDYSDTGGIYYLNIPIPNPGSYILITQCSDSTNLFLNTGIATNHYPISIPGVFAITGNSNVYDPNKPADSVTYFQQFYYPLYDIGLRLEGCPGPITAVTPTTEQAPVITLSQDSILTSSVDSGNAWYLNDSLTTSTGVTDTAKVAGVYYTTVTDPVTGCVLKSNSISYIPGGGGNAAIGLRLGTNPNKGSFLLQFYMSNSANTSIELYDVLGDRVYEQQLSDFAGSFASVINVPNLASGMYVLKITHGSSTYHENVMIWK